MIKRMRDRLKVTDRLGHPSHHLAQTIHLANTRAHTDRRIEIQTGQLVNLVAQQLQGLAEALTQRPANQQQYRGHHQDPERLPLQTITDPCQHFGFRYGNKNMSFAIAYAAQRQTQHIPILTVYAQQLWLAWRLREILNLLENRHPQLLKAG